QLGFDDICAVQTQNPRLQRLLGRDTLVNCCDKLLEDLIAQQWPQFRLVRVRKRGDDRLERDAGTLEELRGVEARVGAVDLVQSFRDRIGQRDGCRRSNGPRAG